MIERKTWEEFREHKLLWFVNRTLHLFGWCICYNYNKDGTLNEVYPARSKFRGFDEKSDTAGFIGLTKYIKDNSEVLLQEAES